MPVIRYGELIRLTGDDAEKFLRNTGRSTLPTTLREYQSAIDLAVQQWEALDTPEGTLMAFLAGADQLVEENGELVKVMDINETETDTLWRLYLKDENTGQIAFTDFGLEHYEELFKEAGIDIFSIKTEAGFEQAVLLSIKYTARALLFKVYADEELKAALDPFLATLEKRQEVYSHD